MPTTYSTAPYHDDYDETKKFYTILFRPGRAVQARELTQLQSLLQSQIERFGNGIYKEGSFVTPPKQTYDPNYTFVKLQDTFNTIEANSVLNTLVGQIIVGQTSGVRAIVVNRVASTNTDPPTIYIKYLNAGSSGTSTSFQDNEILTNIASTISVRAITTSATGTGTAFSIGECTVFAKGYFLFVEEQTLIVEKYAAVSSKIIGFLITTSLVDSDSDSSLLDPAVGTFNYFAPGADRNQISLSLQSRDFIPTSVEDPDYIEILRIQNGTVTSNIIDPEFSILGDTLARRTFDESGNYIVNPFGVSLIEHLRTNNPANVWQESSTVRDGLYPAANGGDEGLFVVNVTPGKAYIKGYEVSNLPTRYVEISKARDFANVNSGTVATQFSSFTVVDGVFSIPSLNDIPNVEIYDRYNAAGGTSNGTKVGSAKIRGFEYVTGNVLSGTARFNLHLFDLQMEPGKSFTRDAKQVYSVNSYNDFTANVFPTLVLISGTATTTTGNAFVVGSGTRFSTETAIGDVITVDNQRFLISNVISDTNLVAENNATANAAGSLVFINTSVINDSDKDNFIIPFPYEVIKAVDPTNTETSYTTKRNFSRTLSSGAVTITAGTDETFAPFSIDNYQVVITSGGLSGSFVVLDSTKITRGGVPTGSTLTINVNSDGFTTETIQAYTTVNKTNSAAIRKTKTLVTNQTADFTSKTDAQSASISLGKADGFKLVSVRMSNVAFGASYVDAGSQDITERYTFDNGQKSTFYGLAKIFLKPGRAKPNNPIRVTFDFFTHGSGDYFSVGSYSGINYKDIPSVVINNTTFSLRDCLDFRPRINDAGSAFTSTGGSTTEFIDPEIDYQTDYEYYLPRTDVVGLDQNGVYFIQDGISSENPIDPNIPSDILPLFILRQKPFVFDLSKDIDVIRVENRRYTMKDISKIDNRVKTLEYYTTLSLLERDAQQSQIKDELGFERFKNGFLVDSFTGHGVGDSIENPDYAVSVNFKTKQASPLVKSTFLNMEEVATTVAQRTSNNYILTGELITLPYTHETFVENKFSSKTENLNPFNVVVFNGDLKLDPPGDLWFDDTRAPEILVDNTGNFDSLSNTSLIKKDGNNIFGSINDIEQLRGGIPPDVSDLPDNLKSLADLIGSISPATSSLSLSGREVIKNVTVIPKMRNVEIDFTARGMRPNTRLFAYFDEVNVTNFCRINSANVVSTSTSYLNSANISEQRTNILELGNATFAAVLTPLTTDATGTVSGVFNYDSSVLGFATGKKLFRLTNSTTNNKLLEDTFAEQFFFSDGIQREIADEILRPPPPPPKPVPAPTVVNTSRNFDAPIDTGYDPEPPAPVTPPQTKLEKIYMELAGRPPDPGAVAFYGDNADKLGPNTLNNIAWGFVNDGIKNYNTSSLTEKTGTAAKNTASLVLKGSTSQSDAALNLLILANQAIRK